MTNSKRFELDGELYTAAGLMRHPLRNPDLSAETIRKRLKEGKMSAKDAIMRPYQRKRAIVPNLMIDGQAYRMIDLLQHPLRNQSVSNSTIKGRIYTKGFDPLDAITRPLEDIKRPYEVKGQYYSLAELLVHPDRHPTINRNALIYRLYKTELTPYEALSLPVNHRHKSHTIDGKVYTLQELLDHPLRNKDLSENTIFTRLYVWHWEPIKAISKPSSQSKANKIKPGTVLTGRDYEMDGQTYKLNELLKHPLRNKELTDAAIKSRLYVLRHSVKDAITLPARYQLVKHKLGNKFYTTEQMLKHPKRNKDLSDRAVRFRLLACGWDVLDAITRPIKVVRRKKSKEGS